jgi:hypothetical protein
MTAMFFSKLKMATLMVLLVVSTVLSTGTLVLSVSRAKEKDAPEKQAPAPTKGNEGEGNAGKSTTLAEISAAYGSNDALGDNKFLGKRLRMTGKVGTIRRVHGSYWMLMRGTPFITCKFNFDSQKQLAELKPNEDLTVEGQCDGRIEEKDGPAEFRLHGAAITFSGCKIVNASK